MVAVCLLSTGPTPQPVGPTPEPGAPTIEPVAPTAEPVVGDPNCADEFAACATDADCCEGLECGNNGEVDCECTVAL